MSLLNEEITIRDSYFYRLYVKEIVEWRSTYSAPVRKGDTK